MRLRTKLQAGILATLASAYVVRRKFMIRTVGGKHLAVQFLVIAAVLANLVMVSAGRIAATTAIAAVIITLLVRSNMLDLVWMRTSLRQLRKA